MEAEGVEDKTKTITSQGSAAVAPSTAKHPQSQPKGSININIMDKAKRIDSQHEAKVEVEAVSSTDKQQQYSTGFGTALSASEKFESRVKAKIGANNSGGGTRTRCSTGSAVAVSASECEQSENRMKAKVEANDTFTDARHRGSLGSTVAVVGSLAKEKSESHAKVKMESSTTNTNDGPSLTESILSIPTASASKRFENRLKAKMMDDSNVRSTIGSSSTSTEQLNKSLKTKGDDEETGSGGDEQRSSVLAPVSKWHEFESRTRANPEPNINETKQNGAQSNESVENNTKGAQHNVSVTQKQLKSRIQAEMAVLDGGTRLSNIAGESKQDSTGSTLSASERFDSRVKAKMMEAGTTESRKDSACSFDGRSSTGSTLLASERFDSRVKAKMMEAGTTESRKDSACSFDGRMKDMVETSTIAKAVSPYTLSSSPSENTEKCLTAKEDVGVREERLNDGTEQFERRLKGKIESTCVSPTEYTEDLHATNRESSLAAENRKSDILDQFESHMKAILVQFNNSDMKEKTSSEIIEDNDVNRSESNRTPNHAVDANSLDTVVPTEYSESSLSAENRKSDILDQFDCHMKAKLVQFNNSDMKENTSSEIIEDNRSESNRTPNHAVDAKSLDTVVNMGGPPMDLEIAAPDDPKLDNAILDLVHEENRLLDEELGEPIEGFLPEAMPVDNGSDDFDMPQVLAISAVPIVHVPWWKRRTTQGIGVLIIVVVIVVSALVSVVTKKVPPDSSSTTNLVPLYEEITNSPSLEPTESVLPTASIIPSVAPSSRLPSMVPTVVESPVPSLNPTTSAQPTSTDLSQSIQNKATCAISGIPECPKGTSLRNVSDYDFGGAYSNVCVADTTSGSNPSCDDYASCHGIPCGAILKSGACWGSYSCISAVSLMLAEEGSCSQSGACNGARDLEWVGKGGCSGRGSCRASSLVDVAENTCVGRERCRDCKNVTVIEPGQCTTDITAPCPCGRPTCELGDCSPYPGTTCKIEIDGKPRCDFPRPTEDEFESKNQALCASNFEPDCPINTTLKSSSDTNTGGPYSNVCLADTMPDSNPSCDSDFSCKDVPCGAILKSGSCFESYACTRAVSLMLAEEGSCSQSGACNGAMALKWVGKGGCSGMGSCQDSSLVDVAEKTCVGRERCRDCKNVTVIGPDQCSTNITAPCPCGRPTCFSGDCSPYPGTTCLTDFDGVRRCDFLGDGMWV